ncbi:Hsp70 family protein [Micromonospora sp. NPDC051296]|uniref:Hsp70 family protein n=1 Tax=Micromonospora sp. NPDC051296 TaxID=3155046 RepID=UPI00343FAEAC
MPYVLGIHIGNTSAVAAVARWQDGGWGRPETVALRPTEASLPSTMVLSPDGTFTLGEVGDASRTARGILGRVGDDVPLLLDGNPYPPPTLIALLAAHVIEWVGEQEGEVAEAIVLSHPAGWGRHRRDLLQQALWERRLGEAALLPRTVTVAESHAARGFPGGLAAVYALGGDTFEAALVRRNSRGRYETVGVPQGLSCLGGTTFDEALAGHVRTVLARELAAAGPGAEATLRGLPAECERAKRDLTVGSQTDVQLSLPTGPVRVPVTRLQFEELIRPAVRATVELLLRAVHAAGLAPARLDGVLLTGASTRIPLVAELLAAAGLPVETAPDPQTTAATGAAVAAAQILTPAPLPAGPPAPAGGVARTPGGMTGRPAENQPPHDEPPPRPPIRFTPLDLPKPSRRTLWMFPVLPGTGTTTGPSVRVC